MTAYKIKVCLLLLLLVTLSATFVNGETRVQCRKNEVFNPKRIKCPPQTCASIYSSYNCEEVTKDEPGCDCISEYLRNGTENDKCIPSSQCPGPKTTVQCRKNEVFNPKRIKCPPQTCASIYSSYNCEEVTKDKPGCDCISEYLRNGTENDKCIPSSQCPGPKTTLQCRENEVFNPKRIKCPPQTCASIYSSYNCEEVTKDEPGCDCISEYLRNGTENDKCIPSSQCPGPTPITPTTPECGINEHYEANGNKCTLTCKNYHLEPTMAACEAPSGCYCDDGFVRNSNRLCIPKKRCPNNIVCGANEVLSECYNSCHTTCRTRLRSDGRMCSLACIDSGCLCKEGYLRHDNGTCVPIDQCSPPVCNENETYTKCGSACPPTCENRGDNCTICTAQCIEDCACSKGFIRSDDGSCVKPKCCPKRICSDPNAKWNNCPPTCPPTDGCSNLWSKFNCTNAIQCCNPQCWCKSGYLRKNGVCVSTMQCLSNE